MKIGDKMKHKMMGCEVTIVEIKNDIEIKCTVECDENKSEVWFFSYELEKI